MTISEPSTVFTDYLLGAVCVGLGTSLLRVAMKSGERSVAFWTAAFFATAVSAFTGGTYHGTLWIVSPGDGTVLWKTTMLFAGLASLFMVLGSAAAAVKGMLRAVFSAVAAFKLLAYLLLIARSDDFVIVVADYVPTMLAVAALQWKNRWVLAGVVLSFLGAALQQSGVGFTDSLNHNDVFHLVQIAAMLAFYRGIRSLRTPRPRPRPRGLNPSSQRP